MDATIKIVHSDGLLKSYHPEGGIRKTDKDRNSVRQEYLFLEFF